MPSEENTGTGESFQSVTRISAAFQSVKLWNRIHLKFRFLAPFLKLSDQKEQPVLLRGPKKYHVNLQSFDSYMLVMGFNQS